MKLIVGLGNPGKEYSGTRHNIGFMAVDAVARQHHIQVRSRSDRSIIGQGEISGEKVILAKPLTFMNLSGQAVSHLVRRCKLDISDVVVICDDVNLPLGRIRIRARGSAGGHNGLKSIIHSLGTDEFARIRVGIGSPRGDMIDHVLSRFGRGEMEIVREMVSVTADAVQVLIRDGIDQAMNQFNAYGS